MSLLTAPEARGIAQQAISLDLTVELATVLENIRVAAAEEQISLIVSGMEEETKCRLRILEFSVIDLQDGFSCVYW